MNKKRMLTPLKKTPLLLLLILVLVLVLDASAQWNTNAPGTNLVTTSPWLTNAPGTNITSATAWRTNAPGTNVTSATAWRTNAPGTNVTSTSAWRTNAPGTNIISVSAWRTNTPGTNVTYTAPTTAAPGRVLVITTNTVPVYVTNALYSCFTYGGGDQIQLSGGFTVDLVNSNYFNYVTDGNLPLASNTVFNASDPAVTIYSYTIDYQWLFHSATNYVIGGWPIEADFTNSTLLGYYKHIGSAMATSNRVWSANNYLVQSNGTTVAFTTNYLGGGSYP